MILCKSFAIYFYMIKYLKHNLALKLDSLGFIASTLCAFHCAAMPFIVVFLTLYGFHFFAHPVFELTLISLSILIGIFTFRHGYFKHHKKIYPFAIFLGGLFLILVGHFLFHDHSHSGLLLNYEDLLLIISPVGAILVGLGHFLNRKLTKAKKSLACSS